MSSLPDRRTLDEQARPSVRRLVEIGPEAEAQIKVLGLALSIESVMDASVAASDGIEPFFGTLKDFFQFDPLPIQGKSKALAFILLALYAWKLIVLFNFINQRLLGEVKPVLELL